MGHWFNLGLGIQALALELVDGKFIDHRSCSIQSGLLIEFLIYYRGLQSNTTDGVD